MAGTPEWLTVADGPLGELLGDLGMISRELFPPGAEAGPAPGNNGGACAGSNFGAGSLTLGDCICSKVKRREQGSTAPYTTTGPSFPAPKSFGN
jgi:hypothetical protein